MARTLGVVMDPIATINFKKDTTLGLLLAAQRAGFNLVYMEQCDLYLEGGSAAASMRPLTVFDDPLQWYQLGAADDAPLSTLDAIIMRKDPPFDGEFIYSTYILEAAEREGVLVINRPQSLRDCNEKVFATQFVGCTPALLVSRDQERLQRFHAQYGDVVFKPLDGMGGSSIFRVREGDQNLNVILETLTRHGRETIMAQQFLPQIEAGDKRVLVVDGEVIDHCLARLPSGGDFRGNLAAGGRGVVQPLTARDREIAAAVAPTLKHKGLLFVGLDIIGDYLTEINVTSPTCLREIEAATGLAIADKLVGAIIRELDVRDLQ